MQQHGINKRVHFMLFWSSAVTFFLFSSCTQWDGWTTFAPGFRVAGSQQRAGFAPSVGVCVAMCSQERCGCAGANYDAMNKRCYVASFFCPYPIQDRKGWLHITVPSQAFECTARDHGSLAKISHVCPQVSGGWSEWLSWGNCSAVCDGGTQRRSRICNHPAPFNGEAECSGNSREDRVCNTFFCVYLYVHPEGQSRYTFAQAKVACHPHNALLATYNELHNAWQRGFESCSCAWISDGTIRNPVNTPSPGCGPRAVNLCGGSTANVFCFRLM